MWTGAGGNAIHLGKKRWAKEGRGRRDPAFGPVHACALKFTVLGTSGQGQGTVPTRLRNSWHVRSSSDVSWLGQ